MVRLQPFMVLVSFIVFLFFICKRLTNKPASNRRNLPPSPPKLPVVGNLHQFGTHPHQSLQSLSRQYGHLMLFHLGTKPALVVSSATASQEIMKTHDALFANRPCFSVAGRIVYNNKDVAFAPYGEHWRQMRSISVLHFLSQRKVRSFCDVRKEEMALMVDKIARSSAPTLVNFSEMFNTVTYDVICRLAFGRKYSASKEGGGGATNFKEILNEATELIAGFHVGDFIPWLCWIQKVNGVDARVHRVVNDIDQFMEEIIKEHEDCHDIAEKKAKASEKEDEVKDLVDVLLEVKKNNPAGFPLERNSIKAVIMDMFVAGTETTSIVMEWAMAEILRHPRIMKELQKEVNGIVGTRKEILEDDLVEMTYLKAVVKETLRLHPPGPLLAARESMKDVKINGYDIIAGTRVIQNIWAIQRDPALWEEPEEFRPERFLESTIDFKGQDFEFLPFGAGRRSCPGMTFAIVIIELTLANLIYHFYWTLPEGVRHETLDMTEASGGITVHRKMPLLAIATPRP